MLIVGISRHVSSTTSTKNNDRGQSQVVASQCSLKEIYFTPQNKTKQKERKIGMGLGVHRECIDNCSLHFFGVSSEKNVNTVIIIALHKSRLMSASPHNCVSPATRPD